MTTKSTDKSQVIVKNKNKQVNKTTSFADLDYHIKQAHLSKALGKWDKNRDKHLKIGEDAFFDSFLKGKVTISGKNANDMRKVLYECSHRYNNRNYKKALSGKITFVNAAKQASNIYQMINGKGMSREELVAILTKFFRFYHVTNAHDTIDELLIFDNNKHIYVPVNNKLDNLCYALYSGFGYGLLKLHAIVRLVENNKYTKVADIDSQKFHEYLQQRKNWVVCNNCIYNRLNGKIMKLSPNYLITSKLAVNYVNGSKFDKIADTSLKNAIHYTKRDAKLYGSNEVLLNQSLNQYMNLWLDGEADGDKGTKRQLLQEILDAFEPYFSHESLVLNYGATRTGKSNFFVPIKTMLGRSQYASMSIDNLDKPKVLSTLVGKSVMLGDDLKANLHIKDGTNLTKIVRGGNVYVEAKYKQGRSTVFCIALLQNTNTLPKTAGKGDWILNRITIVHFKHHYSKNDPLYLNDDIMKRILSNPKFCEVLLHKVLSQPAFSRYIQTPESLKLRKIFAYQNNPIKLFTMKILQAHKNRLIKHILYQQYIQFAKENGYNYRISATQFDTLFKESVSGVTVHQERMNNVQCMNQALITNQFSLKTRKVNANGQPYDKPLIDTPIINKRYPCYVFPGIPKDIIDCDIDGVVFSVLPNDNVNFLPNKYFGVGEHDYDAKILYNNDLLPSSDGIKLLNIIADIHKYGYKQMCKRHHINAKKYRFNLIEAAAFTKYNHKSYIEHAKEANNSTFTDLQFRIKVGRAAEKKEQALDAQREKEASINTTSADNTLNGINKLKQDLKEANAKKSKNSKSKKTHFDKDKLLKPIKVHVKLKKSTDNDSVILDEQGAKWSIVKSKDIKKIKNNFDKLYITRIQFSNDSGIAMVTAVTNIGTRLDYMVADNEQHYNNKLSLKTYKQLLTMYGVKMEARK